VDATIINQRIALPVIGIVRLEQMPTEGIDSTRLAIRPIVPV